MVGRKVSQRELDENPQLKYLLEVNEESKHNISSDVYHESGEQFTQAIKQNEGAVKHFMRHSYLAVGMILGVFASVQLYQQSYLFSQSYEDYLDYVIVEQVKRGRSMSGLARIFYCTDTYSVESRN